MGLSNMFPIPKRAERYSRLTTDDSDNSESDLEELKETIPTGKLRRLLTANATLGVALCIVLLTVLAVGVLNAAVAVSISLQTPQQVTTNMISAHSSWPASSPKSCENPKLRQEWRTLSKRQQYDYIAAVKCLQHVPSRLHEGMSLYDDFPFLHDVIGDYAHETAAFLTWHRYFIHLFEVSLIEKCGYTGSLTYWDWSIDWDDLSKSPVFKSDPGFGGDSSPKGGASKIAIFGGDRCIQDGPFTDIIVHFWTQPGEPHCLSRGFADVVPISEIGGSFKPTAMRKLLQQPDYESFFLSMEAGSHNGIQVAIGGDIMFNTAPYDPIFYLHHTQLDRLWWQWQQLHPSHQWQYLGLANNYSDSRASLEDVISMGNFAPGVTAMQLMDTQLDILCYTYDV